MLVPIILYHKKLLSRPMFYISAYLERNRDIYYERLLAISRDGDWNGWISFFLQALVLQSEENSIKARAILELYNDMKTRIPQITRSQYSIQAIDVLFSSPIISSSDFALRARIPDRTAQRIVQRLEQEGILRLIREGKGSRPPTYLFPDLLDITEKEFK